MESFEINLFYLTEFFKISFIVASWGYWERDKSRRNTNDQYVFSTPHLQIRINTFLKAHNLGLRVFKPRDILNLGLRVFNLINSNGTEYMATLLFQNNQHSCLSSSSPEWWVTNQLEVPHLSDQIVFSPN